jgi:hypothetical protein
MNSMKLTKKQEAMVRELLQTWELKRFRAEQDARRATENKEGFTCEGVRENTLRACIVDLVDLLEGRD